MSRLDDSTAGAEQAARHDARVRAMEERDGELTCTTCGEQAAIDVGCTYAIHYWNPYTPGRRQHRITATRENLTRYLGPVIGAGMLTDADIDTIRGLSVADP